MASGDGVITRKDIITDEALSFGKEYKKNVEEAIKANDELISQFKILLKVSGDYRKAQDSYDYRKAKQEESLANQKILNELKQMEQAERALERIRKEKLKTERELLKIAQENIKLSMSQAQREAQAEKEIERIKQERIKTEKELARLALENERLNKQQAQTAISNERELERVKQELIKTEREQAKLKRDLINLENAEANQKKRSTTLTMEERVQQQLANQADKQSVLSKMKLLEPYRALNAQRAIAKQRLLDLIASEKASTAEIKKAQREFDVLDKRVRKADSAVGDFTKNVGNYKSAFSGLSNLMGAFGVVGGITGVVMLGKSIYQTTKEIQAQEIALRMLSETEETYAKNKEFLTRISEQYGLELMTTTNAYKNYFASAKTSIEEGKMSFENMQLIFEKVSKSASTLGLSVEQQEGAFLALSQMLSKGTVQSEELRGQLGERLPGAFEVMAKALNVSTMELGKMLQNGEVLAADVLPKFAVAYEKAIGADQVERTETLAASQNRLTNTWTEFVQNLDGSKGVISNVFMGISDGISDLIKDLIRLNTSWDELLEKAGKESFNSAYSSTINTGVSKDEAVKRAYELEARQRLLIENQKRLNQELENSSKFVGSLNWLKGNRGSGDVKKDLEATHKELQKVNGDLTAYRHIAYGIKKDKETVNDVISGGVKNETEAERRKREAAAKRAQKEAEKAERKAELLEEKRLKALKESYEAEKDLEIYRLNVLSEIQKEESVNEKNTQDGRFDALMTYFQLEESLLKTNLEKQLTLSRSFQKDKEAFTEQEIQDLINGAESKITLTDQELLMLEKFYSDQEKLRKQNEKGLKENVDFEINLLKKGHESKLLNDHQQLSNELNGLEIGTNLTDVENYEKAAYEIKRKYLLKEIEDNIAFYQSILENENLTHKQKEENTKILLGLQEDLREFNNQSHIESLEKAKEIEDKFMEIGENIKNALVDLTNAIFDNRIQRIDEDIERTNNQYEKQIELYEGDAERQKLIREEQEKAREKLEAKKRKEQHKQAVFNKAMSIADIGFNTAVSIMKGYADLGPIAGSVFAVLASVLGAVQTATVLATPIPKYKMGRKGGKEELAFVGDGGVSEVIEHRDGSAEITPNRDTLVKLLEGDIVHSSVEAYRKSKRNKLNNDLQNDALKYQIYMKETAQIDTYILEKKLDELILVTKSKKSNTTVNVPKIDMGHELWRMKQLGYFK